MAEVILEGTERLDPPTIDGDAPGGPFANHGETDAIAGLSRGKNG